VPESGPGFTAIQLGFAAYVRDPEHAPPPAGIEARRLEVYCDLCFHNVESFMANCYPVLRAILGEARWEALIRDYFREHRAHTVSLPRMPQEFLRYLDAHPEAAGDPPFLRELAEHEWLELEVSFDEQEIGDVAVEADVDCLEGVPVLNPTARLHTYAWPVHRLGPHYQPETPPAEPSHLVVLRTRRDDITFMALTAATARLVNLIVVNAGRSGRELLETIARELGSPQPATVVAAGAAVLEELCAGEILLGARRRA
jgi:hypothetical protein